jgi:hypothetical protein
MFNTCTDKIQLSNKIPINPYQCDGLHMTKHNKENPQSGDKGHNLSHTIGVDERQPLGRHTESDAGLAPRPDTLATPLGAYNANNPSLNHKMADAGHTAGFPNTDNHTRTELRIITYPLPQTSLGLHELGEGGVPSPRPTPRKLTPAR